MSDTCNVCGALFKDIDGRDSYEQEREEFRQQRDCLLLGHADAFSEGVAKGMRMAEPKAPPTSDKEHHAD